MAQSLYLETKFHPFRIFGRVVYFSKSSLKQRKLKNDINDFFLPGIVPKCPATITPLAGGKISK
jgi:hypothetical protein